MTAQPTATRPLAGLLTRRQALKGATLAGAGLLGVTTLAASNKGHSQPADQHDAMRKLWEDHITWTRLFIVSFLAGLPDLDAATQRLLANQADIGNAFVPTYGGVAGEQLTALLRLHILGAADLLAAAKAGNAGQAASARDAWYANGDDIAAFFNRLNARRWPLDDMRAMMRDHLDLTFAEAAARLGGDWAGDVAAYDKIHAQILGMADMLSEGLDHGNHSH